MNPVLLQIATYMSGHKDRASIDPLELGPTLLPHLYILEIQRQEEIVGDAAGQIRLLIRLSGTALDRAFGRCVHGHYLEEFLHGPHSVDVLKGFHDCARDGMPRWMRQVVEITDRPPRYVEGVVFHVAPSLIYGGLTLGEVAGQQGMASFESLLL